MEKQQYIDFSFVKQHADFEKVLGYYNLKPTGRGKQFSVLCPFHDDTNPSLKVTPEKRSFHCFGCGAKGNILDFVRYTEDCDLREAAEILANVCRIDLAPPRPPSNGRPRPVRKVQRLEAAVEGPCEPQAVEKHQPGGNSAPRASQRLQATCCGGSGQSPTTLALKLDPPHPYLTKRGLSKEIVETFGLGLCTKGSMAGRIAIPIHDETGQLVAYAGRWPEGEDKYKLPQGFQKHRVLFNLHRQLVADHLVLVEGYFGVFRLLHTNTNVVTALLF